MFDQSAYDANDGRAKAMFSRLFYECEMFVDIYGRHFVLENPKNKFVEDFFVLDSDGRHVANVEVEVKACWRTHDFPFDNVQLLPRKRKFWIDEVNGGKRPIPTLFVMFNNDLSNHLAIHSDDLYEIYSGGDRVNYASCMTRNDNFYVAGLDKVVFGYLFNKNKQKTKDENALWT